MDVGFWTCGNTPEDRGARWETVNGPNDSTSVETQPLRDGLRLNAEAATHTCREIK